MVEQKISYQERDTVPCGLTPTCYKSCTHMYATAAKMQQLDFYIRLNKDYCSDVRILVVHLFNYVAGMASVC